MTAPQPFTHPDAPGGGEKAPRPRDMQGALVAYAPRIFTPAGAPGNTTGVAGAEPRDRVTADLYILAAPGAIVYGGSPEYESDPKPHTHTIQAPARFTGVWVSSQNIVRALAPGGQVLQGQMVLGRIVRSDVGKKPFNLMSVADTPDMGLALDIWGKLSLGAVRYSEPQPIGVPGYVPAAPNSVQYGAPAAQPAYQAPPAAAPTIDPYQAWLASQQQNAAVAAVPQAPALPPMPPGWTPAAWATLTDAQRAQVLAAQPAA